MVDQLMWESTDYCGWCHHRFDVSGCYKSAEQPVKDTTSLEGRMLEVG